MKQISVRAEKSKEAEVPGGDAETAGTKIQGDKRGVEP